MNFFEKMFFPWDVCCVYCKDENVYKYGFCKSCFDSLSDSEGERCRICLDRINTRGLCAACLKEAPDYERLFAPKTYSGIYKDLLHAFKFNNARYLKHPLALLMRDALPKVIIDEISVIVPVASSKKRIKDYGYNQAMLLAKELSHLINKPVRDILEKSSGGSNMYQLNKEERRKNIRGLYSASGTLSGETVLLVDDICTTGETLRAVSRILKKAGAGKIYALTAARDDIKF